MSHLTEGTVGVSVVAGHIVPGGLPPHPTIGQQVFMGSGGNFAFHITPAIAQQWLPVIQHIAEGSE